MKCITDIKALRELLKQWRRAGESIAFVPTMGNLHAGHLQLVNRAKAQADRVVVSIFVNPTQFGVGEDFSLYPRTEQADQEKLQAIFVDAVFMPSTEEMYPVNELTKVSVSQVSENHCGAARPGHFDGVATVVCKLFNIVQPDKAFFGEKDFQQLTVINAMVADLNLPVEIISVPTVRESDGLAMSSRNGYLTPEQREQAPQLYQSLCTAKVLIRDKKTAYIDIEKQQKKFLEEQGFRPDYFSICRRYDLQTAGQDDSEIVILVAAKIGKTRLIDNIQVDVEH
ncbi:MAG: pantoate--beta-alanine ligase [Methylococcaceae bacterium]|nr:pantoate--beta-alanine ligase [Methylococcaceae bacterium]